MHSRLAKDLSQLIIKAKAGKCVDCCKESKLTAGRCQNCYWAHRKKVKQSEREKKGMTSVAKPPRTIRKLSKKRTAQNTLYLKKRRTFMEQNAICQAQLSECKYLATEVHHRKGRVGDLLTDERYFLAVCRSCHEYIEQHGDFAKSEGFSLSRI